MTCDSAGVPRSLLLTPEPQPQAFPRLQWSGLPGRLVALAVLITLELIALSVELDTSDLPRLVGLTGLIGGWGAAILRAVVSFATLFLTFGLITARSAFRHVSSELARIQISWWLLAGHLCAMIAFGSLSHVLFGHIPANWQIDLVAAVWLATGVFAIALAGIALVPLKLALKLLRSTGSAWVLALFGSTLASLVGNIGRSAWRPMIGLTFDLVRELLRPFISDLIVNPATMAIGSRKFNVTITPACSGFEGAGLMLVFGVVWVWYFRRECRFPQALLLIPVGLILVWFLNSVRIAALILIGNAGAASVAMGGFHSQAGWIAFNAVALAFTFALHRVPWLSTKVSQISLPDSGAENPAAWYLTPFLMILAAAMISRAAANGFEWLYPLRFFAAAAVLLYFWRKYADLDWRVGWAAPVTGCAVFVMWLGLDLMTGAVSESIIGAGLASLSTSARLTWIVFRTLAATVTVPIAEELAFRGFLIRRLISPHFEKVSCRVFIFLPVLVSSIAFGILHGDRWLAGTIAGVLYALALRHRGRIGDAVAAHAITNALLALWVLLTRNWQMW